MKTDYPEFAKKPVTHTNADGNKVNALVIDCSYHVGITFVNASNHDRQILCLNRHEYLQPYNFNFGVGKRIPIGKKTKGWKRAYYLLFYTIVAMIHAGNLVGILEVQREIIADTCENKPNYNGKSANCAWS